MAPPLLTLPIMPRLTSLARLLEMIMSFTKTYQHMPANCSINDIDRAELWVAARDTDTTVMLSGSAMGQPFTLTADITTAGTFTDGESGKVELILGCPVN